MKNDPNVKPDYQIIKLDERQHWHEDVQKQTTAVYGVYAYDKNEHTFLCEMTPSHCLMFLGTDYAEIDGLSEEERNDLNEKILEGSSSSEPVAYMHVRDIERIVEKNPSLSKKADMDFDLDEDLDEHAKWNAMFDQLLEGWNTGALMF